MSEVIEGPDGPYEKVRDLTPKERAVHREATEAIREAERIVEERKAGRDRIEALITEPGEVLVRDRGAIYRPVEDAGDGEA